jgi:hypothetical protein
MNYSEFLYDVELPPALEAGGKLLATSTSPHKEACVVQVTFDKATNKVDGVSVTTVHDRFELADKKASKLLKELESKSKHLVGVVDFIAIPLTRVARNKTYFDANNGFGDADDQIVLDTSTWTPKMWEILQWHWDRLKMAQHFDAKKHDLLGKQNSWDKSGAYVGIPACSTCALTPEQLN